MHPRSSHWLVSSLRIESSTCTRPDSLAASDLPIKGSVGEQPLERVWQLVVVTAAVTVMTAMTAVAVEAVLVCACVRTLV